MFAYSNLVCVLQAEQIAEALQAAAVAKQTAAAQLSKRSAPAAAAAPAPPAPVLKPYYPAPQIKAAPSPTNQNRLLQPTQSSKPKGVNKKSLAGKRAPGSHSKIPSPKSTESPKSTQSPKSADSIRRAPVARTIPRQTIVYAGSGSSMPQPHGRKTGGWR